MTELERMEYGHQITISNRDFHLNLKSFNGLSWRVDAGVGVCVGERERAYIVA